jgi:hypothetical protein
MQQNERVYFRLFLMPCCHVLICWVNPRIPNFCPECGERVYLKLRNGAQTQINDENAWLKYKS